MNTTTKMGRSPCLTLLATLLGLGIATACLPAGARGQTPWLVSYEKALSAQEKGDWKGSLPLLKDALAARDGEKLKAKTYGLRFVNYLPHYYMGVAYFQLKDRAHALESLDRSLAGGAIKDAPEEYAHLRALHAALSGTAAPAITASPAGETGENDAENPSPGGALPWYVSYEAGLAYTESGDWLKAIENLRLAISANGIPRRYARTYGMWFITYIPYYYLGVSYYNQGLWRLAVNYLETSDRLGEVRELGTESANLRSLLEDARKRGGSPRAPAASEEVRSVLTTAITEGVRLFNQEDFASAEARFSSALRLDPYNSIARNYLARIRERGALQTGDAVANKDFSGGVLHLLKGRHEKAIAMFTGARSEMDDDPSLHAYLGVAYFQRYRSSAKKDKGALRLAREEFRRSLALEPSYQLDRTIFSRDVTDLFQRVRKGE
jgi:tetratricopeptide (TPR) repeat protein